MHSRPVLVLDHRSFGAAYPFPLSQSIQQVPRSYPGRDWFLAGYARSVPAEAGSIRVPARNAPT